MYLKMSLHGPSGRRHNQVHLAECVTTKGIIYKKGMILVHRAVGGLPEFSEVDQICIVHKSVFFIVEELCGWYSEHFRVFELSPAPTRTFSLVALSELLDNYPLADYKIGLVRVVTLKRQIVIKGMLTYGELGIFAAVYFIQVLPPHLSNGIYNAILVLTYSNL